MRYLPPYERIGYTRQHIQDVVDGLEQRAMHAFDCDAIPLPDRQHELDAGNRFMGEATRICQWANAI